MDRMSPPLFHVRSLLLLLMMMMVLFVFRVQLTTADANFTSSTEKQMSTTLATTMATSIESELQSASRTSSNVSTMDAVRKDAFQSMMSRQENGNSGWKGFVVGVSEPVETGYKTSSSPKTTTTGSPDYARIFHDYFSTPLPLPPIYRPKYPTDQHPDGLAKRRPVVYVEPMTTIAAKTTPSYYSYYNDGVTSPPPPSATRPYYVATNPPPYTYAPPAPPPPAQRNYMSNAIMGKSYGGSGGGGSPSPSYGSSMGMGGNTGMQMHGYDNSYMMQQQQQPMAPPSAGSGSMYGMYGGSGAGSGAGGGMMTYGAQLMPAAAKEESSLKSFINKLLAFLPVGLLLAVALPSLVVVPGGRSLDDDEAGFAKIGSANPMLDMIDYYGVDSLRDEGCFQLVLCKTARLGSQHGANVFQEQLWAAINWMDATLAKSMGMERLWTAILRDQCATFSCVKRED